MEEEINRVEEVDNKIKQLKEEKKKIQQSENSKKYYENKNTRLKSKNHGKANVPTRVSINCMKYMDFINKKREENGLDSLSYPKVSELMVKHKKHSKPIQVDIINYNTKLDIENGDGDFNEK